MNIVFKCIEKTISNSDSRSRLDKSNTSYSAYGRTAYAPCSASRAKNNLCFFTDSSSGGRQGYRTSSLTNRQIATHTRRRT
jgi:hypothetical protein